MSGEFHKITIIFILMLSGACQSEPSGLPFDSPTETRAAAPIITRTTFATLEATTPAPKPTSTLLVTPTLQGQPSVLLREDFSNAQTCMESFDNERASAGVEDGGYVIEVRAADEIVSANCETLVVGNFSLEVDVTVEAFTPGGVYYFGLLFRVAGNERYVFAVGSEGGYCAYYASDIAFVPLTNSTDFPVQCWVLIPESAKAEGKQHLRVVALDDRLDLYLNGELLAVVRDRKLREGWVGFVVATAGEGGVRVMFDNLVVSRR